MAHEHPIEYLLDVDDATFPVREVRGHESISKPFRFEVRFHREGGLPDSPEDTLRRGARVRMVRDGVTVRSIAGIVTEAWEGAVTRGAPEVTFIVEPQLALLRERVDYRIFRDKSVPEIVEEVLGIVGIQRGAEEGPSKLSVRLRGSYDKRAYTVQRRESDLDFIHRLLEDEGIHYFFLEQDGLVLGDSPAGYEPISGERAIPFRPLHGMDRHDDAITRIARRASVSVGKVALRDFSFERPSLDLSVAAAGPTRVGPELYDYPGEYVDPAVGAKKAALWAEALSCEASGFFGQSISGRIAPGHVFTLDEAPDGIGDGEHVITGVEHDWQSHTKGFVCSFASLEAERTFRPPRVTPVPLQESPLTAIVTGPAGEDIHVDPLGRVKIHFPWDRIQPWDDNCSNWVPVLQDNTGHSVGIPRVGWEVLAHFLEGDPDRPVVLGRVYNAEDNFPNELPANKTKSALKSLSSPGRNGTNQIELEDAAGREQITVLAERDQRITVAHDKRAKIGNDEEIAVVRDEKVEIGHDQTAKIDGSFDHTVEGNQTRTVGGSRSRTVAGSEKATVVADRSLTIGGSHHRRIGTDDVVQAKKLVEKIAAVNVEASVKTNTITSGRTSRLTVGGALIEVAKDSKSEAADKLRVETIGGLSFTSAGAGISQKADKARMLNVGGILSATAVDGIAVDSGLFLKWTTGMGAVEAESVMLKVGSTFIMLKGGVAVINAAKKVTLNISGSNQLGDGAVAMIPADSTAQQAQDGGTSGDAAKTSGSGKTGSGNVSADGRFKAGDSLLGALPKPPASPLEALQNAAMQGFSFDPQHAAGSMMETLRSYAGQMGIRQAVDGLSIPLSGAASDMLGALEGQAASYAGAQLAGAMGGLGTAGAAAAGIAAGYITSPQAEAMKDAGLAWEKIGKEQASASAAAGDMVIAGGWGAGGNAHVATVMPGGKPADDGVTYPYVSGGGPPNRASDGTRTAGEVWGAGEREDVAYYRFVPPVPGS